MLSNNSSKLFCAIGGTWRSFAKIMQVQTRYPLHMVQHYMVPADEVLALCHEIVALASAGSLRISRANATKSNFGSSEQMKCARAFACRAR